MKQKDTRRVEIHSGPDSRGRYVYTLFWWDYHPGDKVAGIQPGEYRERGQVFHAPLPRDVCTCWPEHDVSGTKHELDCNLFQQSEE